MKFSTSPFLYKLNYLIKHKANLPIILAFLKFQISKPFFNHIRSREKRNYKTIIKDKKITHDFFSLNTFDWKKNLKKYKNRDIRYLEIGSFEGISSYFISEYLVLKEIHCVDTWEGSPEHHQINFRNIELNFDNNSKDIKKLIDFTKKNNITDALVEAKSKLKCNTTRCVLNHLGDAGRKDKEIYLKVEGPTDVSLLNNFNIDNTLKQWTFKYKDFFPYDFNMRD